MAGGNAIPTELGTKPIASLLRQYAVPGIIAMTASSLYNMVDSIYIGHIPEVGSLSMAGLAVTFPLMNISTAFGTLVGVGAATMISVLLGQKNYKAAEKVLCNDVTLNLITGIVFTFVTLMWMDPILRFFGATEASLPYARNYMFYIAIGNAVTHLYFGLNAIVRSSGNPKLAMGLTLFTVISNAILDPIFIFVLGLGIRGAALATILCQTMSLCYTLWYFLDQKKFLHLPRSRHIFRVDWRIAKDSLAIGLGPFLMNLASCIVVLFINQQLVKWGGDMALGAFGIVNRVSFLFIMVVMGFNQGMQPIAGYNYGARQYGRVKEVYIRTAIWGTIVFVGGFLIAMFLPKPVAAIFTNDPALEELAAHGFKVMSLAFPIVGFQMVTTNLFQCLGMVKKSVFLSLSRQLLFLLPCIYILPGIMQSVAGVWYSFPISDAISSIITAIFGWNLIIKLNKLKDGDDPSILGGQI